MRRPGGLGRRSASAELAKIGLQPVGSCADRGAGGRAPWAYNEPLLAVLPFDNLSGDAELLYFTDGVSEEQSSRDGRAVDRPEGDWTVIQLPVPGADSGQRRVAAELNCSHLLDGSVRRSGARVRISASLVECVGQTTLWTGRFDRDLSDVFALQDEIGAAVAVALKSTFEPSLNAGPIDPAAYDPTARPDPAARSRGLQRRPPSRSRRTRAEICAGVGSAGLCAVKPSSLRRGPRSLCVARRGAASSRTGPHAGSWRWLGACRAWLSARALRRIRCVGGLGGQGATGRAARSRSALPGQPRPLLGRPRPRGAGTIEYVIELDPLYAQGANWRALMLDAAGHDAEARDAYRAARDRWPDFEFLFLNASVFAARHGDWDWVDEMAGEMRRLGIDTPLVRRVARSTDLASWGRRVPGRSCPRTRAGLGRDRFARAHIAGSGR